MFKHKSKVEIRFADIDAFGHVNNAKYLTYIEQARVCYFDDIVGWQYDLTAQGIILAKVEIDFIFPAHFKDDLTIKTRCSRLGNKSFDLEYQIIRYQESKEILIADACTVMVAFDYQEKKSILLPPVWREAILKYEGENVLVQ